MSEPKAAVSVEALQKIVGIWLKQAKRDQTAGGVIEAVRCNTLRECAGDLAAAALAAEKR